MEECFKVDEKFSERIIGGQTRTFTISQLKGLSLQGFTNRTRKWEKISSKKGISEKSTCQVCGRVNEEKPNGAKRINEKHDKSSKWSGLIIRE